MKVRLGYVALPLTIDITSSHTITYTNYKKIDNGLDKIEQLVIKNLEALHEILKYNTRNQIHFYRMTSNLIPLATVEELNFDYINQYLNIYEKIGRYANSNHIRIDMHPDQFCVLNSTNPKIVRNSIAILKYHQELFDAFHFNYPKLIIHIGSSQGGKKASLTRFRNNFKKLPLSIQKMIVIENDDKVFSVTDVLFLCEALKVPMVLDYHHFLCHNNGELLQDYLPRIFNTWQNDGYPPKVHFSSPKNQTKKDYRSHHDYISVDDFISFLELVKEYTDELDIMIEAKQKDFALFKLVRELKYKTNYMFLDETTFIVQ